MSLGAVARRGRGPAVRSLGPRRHPVSRARRSAAVRRRSVRGGRAPRAERNAAGARVAPSRRRGGARARSWQAAAQGSRRRATDAPRICSADLDHLGRGEAAIAGSSGRGRAASRRHASFEALSASPDDQFLAAGQADRGPDRRPARVPGPKGRGARRGAALPRPGRGAAARWRASSGSTSWSRAACVAPEHVRPDQRPASCAPRTARRRGPSGSGPHARRPVRGPGRGLEAHRRGAPDRLRSPTKPDTARTCADEEPRELTRGLTWGRAPMPISAAARRQARAGRGIMLPAGGRPWIPTSRLAHAALAECLGHARCPAGGRRHPRLAPSPRPDRAARARSRSARGHMARGTVFRARAGEAAAFLDEC